jgi:hypothetical protein
MEAIAQWFDSVTASTVLQVSDAFLDVTLG